VTDNVIKESTDVRSIPIICAAGSNPIVFYRPITSSSALNIHYQLLLTHCHSCRNGWWGRDQDHPIYSLTWKPGRIRIDLEPRKEEILNFVDNDESYDDIKNWLQNV
jgi:hypothetical protein